MFSGASASSPVLATALWPPPAAAPEKNSNKTAVRLWTDSSIDQDGEPSGIDANDSSVVLTHERRSRFKMCETRRGWGTIGAQLVFDSTRDRK